MTDIALDEKLLPCPHCGGKAELHTNRIAEDVVQVFVMCSACLATTDNFEDTYAPTADAIAAWNRRASPSQVAPQPQAGEPVADGLPDRDPNAPTEQQGLFRKFDVRRVDGSDAPGGKHHGCRYFVLDVDHDQHARAALSAYAGACETTHPDLARDLREKWGAASQQAANPAQVTDEFVKRLLKEADFWSNQPSGDEIEALLKEAAATIDARPTYDVTNAATSIAAMVADWYGSLALPKAHIPASVIAKRLSRFAAIGAGGQAVAAFGDGKLVIDTGTAGGKPAVFIAPAKRPGEVGASAKRENLPKDHLIAGEWYMTFPTDEQARLVADALCNALSQPHPADERVVEALERMVALYESEYDADVPFVRPDWLVAALAAKDCR